MIRIKHLAMAVAFAAAGLFANAAVGTTAQASDAQATKVADLDLQVQYGGGNRVCCKRGQRDWWSTARQCRRSGGHITANRACRDGRVGYNDSRVCCKRGYRDWWSTSRQCRRSGGYIVANRACRR